MNIINNNIKYEINDFKNHENNEFERYISFNET